ncbi:MAG: hypothetical protein IBJ04_03825 [Hydrogenophaga sp.]|uniref:pilus assembly PilX family protein n=1 Tax=Hydrogenophaga sp. TaxID=1904254 RepID=UPI002580E8F2|nr:hypothetical protein [Hydrogenophaga sp.]MBL0943450.1 hypothetical protein [Hydrogenophaga sp.]
MTPSRSPCRGPAPVGGQHGTVLPVVLFLLTVLALAGLFAARRSATVEEIANNSRMGEVARLAAESALRYCEAVVIDAVEDGTLYDNAVKARLVTAPPLSDAGDAQARWAAIGNWVPGAVSLIEVPAPADSVSTEPASAPAPTCMAEAMTRSRYLVTARGLSAGAAIDPATGALVGLAGSEVWLQAIVSPTLPVRSASGAGYE